MGLVIFFYERTACPAEGKAYNTFIAHLHYIQIGFKTSLYQSQSQRQNAEQDANDYLKSRQAKQTADCQARCQ